MRNRRSSDFDPLRRAERGERTLSSVVGRAKRQVCDFDVVNIVQEAGNRNRMKPSRLQQRMRVAISPSFSFRPFFWTSKRKWTTLRRRAMLSFTGISLFLWMSLVVPTLFVGTKQSLDPVGPLMTSKTRPIPCPRSKARKHSLLLLPI
jgi:hypothetical protein